jgi:hypothetical protein
MEIPVTELKVVMLYDMLEACEPELEEYILRRFDDQVSFGDAEYTIVKWYRAEAIFYSALYDSGKTQEESSKFMAQYNAIVGHSVALIG